MPYANNNGVKIYYEVEGEGPPLVLAHGAGSDLGGWQRLGGYRDSLKNDYKLILFDARGHGRSDKPHDLTAYGTKMADDVVAILDALEINKSHYFGYSMGAWTGIMLASSHSERFQSFIIGGASPYRGEADSNIPFFTTFPHNLN
jgi:pimeloyl-ACP methyl ester carboxylesterase